jgi:hypothetical protein
MVEEVLTPGQQIVGNPEVLEQSFRGELVHAVGRAGCAAGDSGMFESPKTIRYKRWASESANDVGITELATPWPGSERKVAFLFFDYL